MPYTATESWHAGAAHPPAHIRHPHPPHTGIAHAAMTYVRSACAYTRTCALVPCMYNTCTSLKRLVIDIREDWGFWSVA